MGFENRTNNRGVAGKNYSLSKWLHPYGFITDWSNVQYLFALGIIYSLAAMTIKLSIILLYTRVFSTANTTFRRCIYAAFFFTVALSVTFIVVILASCQPMQFFWTQYDGVSEGTCINISAFFVAFSIFNVSLDVYLLVLPIPMVLKLHMSVRKKLIVCALMMLGILYVFLSSCLSERLRYSPTDMFGTVLVLPA